MAQLASSTTPTLMQRSDLKDPMSVWLFIRRDGCDGFGLPSILHQRQFWITGLGFAPLDIPVTQSAFGSRAWSPGSGVRSIQVFPQQTEIDAIFSKRNAR